MIPFERSSRARRVARRRAAGWATTAFLVAGSFLAGSANAQQIPGDPEDLQPIRRDADGGATLELHVDDPTGGTYGHYDLPETIAHEDVSIGLPGRQSVGLYVHDWEHEGRPAQTVGLVADLAAAEGNGTPPRVRVPLFILENAQLDHAAILELVWGERLPVADSLFSVLPVLLNLAMPGTAPMARTAGAGAYGDPAPIYLWLARKQTPLVTVWTGFFVDRAWTASSTDADRSDYRVEIGAAIRTGSETAHVTGLFVQSAFERRAAGLEETSETVTTAGTTVGGEDVPLVELRFAESREGEQRLEYAEDHEGSVTIGVRAGDEFVPLAWTKTHQKVDRGSDSTNQGEIVASEETHRRTEIGVALGATGSWVPLVGYDYQGERRRQDGWLTAHLAVGPGDQTNGDWLASVGTYLPALGGGADWLPLAGFAYDDDFGEHHHEHRSRYSAGLFVGDAYRPTVATTYDGDLPLLVWANDFAGGTGEGGAHPYGRWEVATGVVAEGAYLPAAGLTFGPGVPVGGQTPRDHEWQLRAGAYLGDYDLFFPLLYAAYSGDQALPVWASAFVTRHVLWGEGREGEADVTGGATAAGAVFVPVAATYAPGPATEATPDGRGFYFVAGAWAPEVGSAGEAYGFVPLVGVSAARSTATDGRYEVALLQPEYATIACVRVDADAGSIAAVPCDLPTQP